METLNAPDTNTTPPPQQPARQPTWWDLYTALATHGHTHPDLQPVQIQQPSPGLTHTQPGLLATLELLPAADHADATAFADWVDSLDTCFGITAVTLYAPRSDTMVTALGLLGDITIALWTVIHGTATGLADTGGHPTPVTAGEVRAVDVLHGALRDTDNPDNDPAVPGGDVPDGPS